MLECKLCNFIGKNQHSLSCHTKFSHDLKFPEYLIKIKYNGEKPTCGCGCGKETRYEAKKADFLNFISGHHTRKEGYWGDLKDPKKAEKISKTRKEKFQTTEYNHIREGIKNRDNIALGKSISKRMKGVAKPKPKGFGEGRIHSQETKDKMSNTAINNIIITDKNHTSKLEKYFEGILILMGVKYKKFLYAKEIKAFYDFYIPEINLVIEVDGDFWHCNPNSKHAISKYDSQKKNILRDKEKEQWLKDNGYKLLRFWETDINNNILEVKRILLENLN